MLVALMAALRGSDKHTAVVALLGSAALQVIEKGESK